MQLETLWGWWWRKQCLDGGQRGRSAADVLQTAGWARSVGSSNPYLSLHARAGLRREAVDAAVAALEICELPAARGCTYVLPSSDFALGLKLGQPAEAASFQTAVKVGVTDQEIDKLCGRILDALGKGPLDPDELKKATGGAVRHLGEEGKKKGVTTTLPVALGRLQSLGEIRRVPANGRLDAQRYQYTIWSPNPLAKFRLDADACAIELARRYFRWIGPATIAEFQWFSALSKKAATAAIDACKLSKLPGQEDRLLFADDLDALQSKRPQAAKTAYALISSLDSMLLLRRNFQSLMTSQDSARQAAGERGPVSLGGLADLPNNAILENGRIAGLWEFDPAEGKIVWLAFDKKSKAIEAAVSDTEAFIRDQLGDARTFSLDSPKSRAPKLDALRKLG